ncbi:DNA polymerase subunit beta [Candidatus Geothermarchaeota archaeon]|nr:MAG: DNA polymerase subunit beta [Candidatus Geothermarchaeota archaeon]
MICRPGEWRGVIYNKDRIDLLKKFRREAIKISKPLYLRGLNPYVYGSVARGDVNPNSDIDIIILRYVSPFLIESTLESYGFEIRNKVIIQATPYNTPKVYYWLDDYGKKVVSYLLKKLTSNEISFYRFGGMIDYNSLGSLRRVPGVDKRLMLIQPTNDGHIETCIIGREGWASKILSIPESIVNERVYMLSKREIYGRTGVFLEYTLSPGEDIAMAIKYLKNRNRYFREAIEKIQ